MTVTLLQIVLLQVPSALRKYVVVAAGATVTLLPVPTDVPPQLPLYHFQLAPAPKLPPLTLSVVFLPRQIVVVPVIEVAGIDVSRTFRVCDTHFVVLQPLSALRK